MKRIIVALMCLSLLAVVTGLFTACQERERTGPDGEWRPSRPVRIIVGAAAGGGTDLVARTMAEALGPIMGTTFQVVNVLGGSGGIAMAQVLGAPLDGHTIFGANEAMHSVAVLGTFPHTSGVWDLYIATGSEAILSVNTNSPLETFEDLRAAVRAREVLGAGSNPGSIWGVKFAQFQALMGPDANITFIPFTGSAPSNIAVMTGEVEVSITAAAEQLSFIQAGEMRPLIAIEREDVYVPGFGTVRSISHYYPEFDDFPQVGQWLGFAFPELCRSIFVMLTELPLRRHGTQSFFKI
ncbi:MAG: tripartite tricarboxylate transporter substrate-binding protein [Treponema sp.]|nr:tripartite tricarboxylate transporter substrate-binding protein [Treponema sp.]